MKFWPFGKKKQEAEQPEELTEDQKEQVEEAKLDLSAMLDVLKKDALAKKQRITENAFPKKIFPDQIPSVAETSGTGMDASTAIGDIFESAKDAYSLSNTNLPNDILDWYISFGFIGHQACALLAQHWFIKKACTMPSKDAIRKGYELTVNDGEDVDMDKLAELRSYDKYFNLNKSLKSFEQFRRMFGIRVAVALVDSSDPKYYENPFNIDGIKKGTYKGMQQVDPYWIKPVLTTTGTSDPLSLDYYNPEYWIVHGRIIHRSHLVIGVMDEVADVLKPTYEYGGISIPQRLYSRLYAAERIADEVPALAMSKRIMNLKKDLDAAVADPQQFGETIAAFTAMRDNFQVAISDTDESMEQFETSLTDLDAAIMTEFQLACAIVNVPATKMLGTSPKGFNATGENEVNNYHEELESIQEELEPFLDMHYMLLSKSLYGEVLEFDVTFNPVKSMSNEQIANVNKSKMETHKGYSDMGVVMGDEIRDSLIADENSGYNGLEPFEDLEDLENDDDLENKELDDGQETETIEE